MTIFLTPAGTRDEGGVIQPAYLNFDAALLGPPANGMTVRTPLHAPLRAGGVLMSQPSFAVKVILNSCLL